MASAIKPLLALSLLLVSAAPDRVAATPGADLVFRGGAIYTVNDEQPWAEAVAVDEGRIVYVGPARGAEPFIEDSTEVVEIGGGLVLPGFHDSHMHPMRAGTRFLRCQMAELAWPDEVLAELRRCQAKLRPGQWLRGTGLPDEYFDSGVLSKSYLDAIAPDRPAFITNHSGFKAWVNSTALQISGIDQSTPDPEDGAIVREPGSGQPSGVLVYAAAGPVYEKIPEPDETDLREALKRASRMANAFGITSSNEALVRVENWQAFVAADRAGELTLRIHGAQEWDWARGLEQLDAIRQRRDAHSSRFFRADSVKLFLDGSLISNHGAALLQPYANSEGDFGKLRPKDPQQIADIVQAVDAAGMNVHMHALGDRAVRYGLDAIDAAIEANPPCNRRHQLAHIALIHPDDLSRFKALDVTANYQALWAYLSEERKNEIDLLGPDRAGRVLAIRSMLDSGARVVLGSDWISESMNPLYSIQIAVTRRPPDGSGPAWLPEQRIALEDAIRAYTIEGAWLAGQDKLTGSIEVGKAADLVVLENNVFEVDPMDINRVRVLRTLLGGKTVYRRTSSQP